MADQRFLPAESVRPVPRGGAVRPSVVADIGDLSAVVRRRDLDARLLDGTCGFAGGQEPGRWTVEDLDLLLLVSVERFGGESALLRRQSVLALGDLDDDRALRRLRDLALCPVDHDTVRVAALRALGDRGREIAETLVDDVSPAVAAAARRILGEERPERPRAPLPVPGDREDPEDGCCARSCC
jgi:hypothetical protein